LVLAPTRELATQIQTECERFAPVTWNGESESTVDGSESGVHQLRLVLSPMKKKTGIYTFVVLQDLVNQWEK